MQKLTPEEALAKAKKTYTEGVEYKSTTGSAKSFKVCAADVVEYTMCMQQEGTFCIFAPAKGTLYDSKTDTWAEIITPAKEIPTQQNYGVADYEKHASKLPAIKKIVFSCDTEQQLDTCKQWADYIYPNPCEDRSTIYDYIDKRKRELEFTYCKVHIMD